MPAVGKDIRQLLKRLTNIGWRAELQKSGHYRLYPPEGEEWERSFYTAPQTTACWNTILDFRKLVKRAEKRSKNRVAA